MKFNIYKLIILFGTIVSLNSCGNVFDSDSNIIKTPLIEDSFASAYFPNTIGSYWKYNVLDNINNIVDTLTVSIVSNSNLPGNVSATKWTYIYNSNPGKNFVKYIVLKDSSVFEYNSINDTQFIKKIQFPLEVGNKWFMGNPWDTIPNLVTVDTARVVNKKNVTFMQKSYTVYTIIRTIKVLEGVFGEEPYEYIPGLGILRENKGVIYVGGENLVLFDFHLN